MLSKNEIKFIRSLAQSKFREKSGQFIAEGSRGIVEFMLAGKSIHHYYGLAPLPELNENIPFTKITGAELKRISGLVNPQDAVAVMNMEKGSVPTTETFQNSLVLALDQVKDPGNMGTIIRTADWFGIQHLICSEGCADVYNPKVVQATMGSLARVNVVQTDLEELVTKLIREDNQLPVMAATLDGISVKEAELTGKGLLIMGNESAGIGKELSAKANIKLRIPSFGKAESLNVAVATGILCAVLRLS